MPAMLYQDIRLTPNVVKSLLRANVALKRQLDSVNEFKLHESAIRAALNQHLGVTVNIGAPNVSIVELIRRSLQLCVPMTRPIFGIGGSAGGALGPTTINVNNSTITNHDSRTPLDPLADLNILMSPSSLSAESELNAALELSEADCNARVVTRVNQAVTRLKGFAVQAMRDYTDQHTRTIAAGNMNELDITKMAAQRKKILTDLSDIQPDTLVPPTVPLNILVSDERAAAAYVENLRALQRMCNETQLGESASGGTGAMTTEILTQPDDSLKGLQARVKSLQVDNKNLEEQVRLNASSNSWLRPPQQSVSQAGKVPKSPTEIPTNLAPLNEMRENYRKVVACVEKVLDLQLTGEDFTAEMFCNRLENMAQLSELQLYNTLSDVGQVNTSHGIMRTIIRAHEQAVLLLCAKAILEAFRRPSQRLNIYTGDDLLKLITSISENPNASNQPCETDKMDLEDLAIQVKTNETAIGATAVRQVVQADLNALINRAAANRGVAQMLSATETFSATIKSYEDARETLIQQAEQRRAYIAQWFQGMFVVLKLNTQQLAALNTNEQYFDVLTNALKTMADQLSQTQDELVEATIQVDKIFAERDNLIKNLAALSRYLEEKFRMYGRAESRSEVSGNDEVELFGERLYAVVEALEVKMTSAEGLLEVQNTQIRNGLDILIAVVNTRLMRSSLQPVAGDDLFVFLKNLMEEFYRRAHKPLVRMVNGKPHDGSILDYIQVAESNYTEAVSAAAAADASRVEQSGAQIELQKNAAWIRSLESLVESKEQIIKELRSNYVKLRQSLDTLAASFKDSDQTSKGVQKMLEDRNTQLENEKAAHQGEVRKLEIQLASAERKARDCKSRLRDEVKLEILLREKVVEENKDLKFERILSARVNSVPPMANSQPNDAVSSSSDFSARSTLEVAKPTYDNFGPGGGGAEGGNATEQISDQASDSTDLLGEEYAETVKSNVETSPLVTEKNDRLNAPPANRAFGQFDVMTEEQKGSTEVGEGASSLNSSTRPTGAISKTNKKTEKAGRYTSKNIKTVGGAAGLKKPLADSTTLSEPTPVSNVSSTLVSQFTASETQSTQPEKSNTEAVSKKRKPPAPDETIETSTPANKEANSMEIGTVVSTVKRPKVPSESESTNVTTKDSSDDKMQK